jgi:4-carboxymuconolactone decarboxylase
MKKLTIATLIVLILAVGLFSFKLSAQNNPIEIMSLNPAEQSIVAIAALTAKGDLSRLKTELNAGLDAGLTINQIKEVMVHLYAYCGFPRSIRGLQTFMEVLEDRKARGIKDAPGAEASPIQDERSKYERGREILGKLTGAPQDGPKTGYSAFAPTIDVFLKEHLFADIFERDVLTYSERELVTVSVLSSIGGAEPMLRSHLTICLNVGLTPEQLQQFVNIIKSTIGKKESKATRKILDEVLKNNKRK